MSRKSQLWADGRAQVSGEVLIVCTTVGREAAYKALTFSQQVEAGEGQLRSRLK